MEQFVYRMNFEIEIQVTYTLKRAISIRINTEIIIVNPSKALPPLLKKGKGIPMTGISPNAIPILTKKCKNRTPATA